MSELLSRQSLSKLIADRRKKHGNRFLAVIIDDLLKMASGIPDITDEHKKEMVIDQIKFMYDIRNTDHNYERIHKAASDYIDILLQLRRMRSEEPPCVGHCCGCC